MEKYINVEILVDKDRYRSIYPEVYSVEDIIRKRIILRDRDKESDDVFWSEYFLRPCDPQGKYFNANRIGKIPPMGYGTMKEFLKWQFTEGYGTFVWIDPGGKGSKGHGITMVVFNVIEGANYLYQIIVEHGGILRAAAELAHLVLAFNVKGIGCESNFDQEETYSNTLDREMKAYLIDMGKESKYIRITPIKNKGDKMLRIRGQINQIVGIDSEPVKFFVNKEARDYDQFIQEYTYFGDTSLKESDFDVLDAVSSVHMHMIKEIVDFWWISSESEDNSIYFR